MGDLQSSALQVIIANPGKLEDYYSVNAGRALGIGSFGVVREATVIATKASRAVKGILKDKMKTRIDSLKQEMEIMRMVDHLNVVMLYEIFEDTKSLHLVLELCSGGTLHGYIRKRHHLTEKSAAGGMQQIFRAVNYLHKNSICHRDIKSQNVLLSSPGDLSQVLLKVSDFGLSCTFADGQMMRSLVGTLPYTAPEVLDKLYDHKCDIWSCGVMLYNMLSGQLPFADEAEIRRGHFSMAARAFSDVSQDFFNVLTQLLDRSPANRISASKVLQHDWFKKWLPKRRPVELHSGLLEDLKTYRSFNKFKRATLCALASMLGDAEVNPLREIFVSLDEDGDGFISLAELQEQLRNSQKHAKVDVRSAFEERDVTGKLQMQVFSYTEFLAATFDRKKNLTPEACLVAFMSFDKNNDGLISLSELGQGRLLGQLSPEELQQTLQDLDQDGDSCIDFAEFMEMMRL